MSGADLNVAQPKASGDLHFPQLQMATFEEVKCLMEAIVLMKTPWSILSNDKYWMIEEASKIVFEVQDYQ